MHLEMQFDSQKLLSLLRQRFLQQTICITDPITITLHKESVTFYFDHLVISDKTRFQLVHSNHITVYGHQHVQGNKLQLLQPLTIFLATLEDLQYADNKAADYQEFGVDVIFDVFLSRDKHGLSLHVDFNDLVSDVGLPVPDSVKQIVKDKLADATKPTPIDLSSLKGLTGNDFAVAEAFVGSDPHLKRIVIRVEQQSSSLEGASAWEQFLTGDIANHLDIEWTTTIPGKVLLDSNGKPIKGGGTPPRQVHHSITGTWSLFLSFGIIKPAFHDAIDPGIGTQTTDFLVQSNSVKVNWSPMDFDPEVGIKFHGSAHTPPWGIDVGVDVTLSLFLGVDGHGGLVTDGTVDYSVNGWDEFWASLASAGIGLIGGMIIGAIIGGPFGAAIGGVVGFIVGFVGTIIAFAVYSPSFSPPHCTTSKDGKSFSCTQSLPLPKNDLLGQLTVDTIAGLSAGPLFLGKIAPAAHIKQIHFTSVVINKWSWGYQDVCGSPTLQVAGGVEFFAAGSPSLEVCQWSIPDGTDPNGVLWNNVKVTTYPGAANSSIVVEIDIPADSLDGYFQDPYPLQLLFQTNAGTRYITLKPIDALTDQQKQQLQLGLIEQRVGCEKLSDGFWSATGRFNPKWNVDPGPEGEIDGRWYAVGVSGLDQNERVLIEDAKGSVLVQAQANQAGFARLDAVTGPSGEIAVVHVSAKGESVALRKATHDTVNANAKNNGRRVTLSQTALARASRIELHRECKSVTAGILDGTPFAFCVTDGDLHELFDLSDPFRPAWLRRLVIPGLRGAVSWGEGLLLWGSEGMQLLNSDQSELAPLDSLPRNPISHVVADRQLVVQYDNGTSMTFDHRWRAVTSPLVQHARDSWPIAGWLKHALQVGRTLVQPEKTAIQLWRIGRNNVQG